MTEILTESFCERCGTRYTFEAVEAKRGPLGKIGTLGRGLRHFVSDPDTSLDEAFAVARSEQDQRSTTHALEAFHQTFNFCLNCRQYTCGDCWNAVEGRCLTCSPTPEAAPPETRSDRAVRLSAVDLAAASAPILVDPIAPAAETNGLPPQLEPIDLAVARADARAQAEVEHRSEKETRAAASAKAEEAAAEEWARITAEALAAEEAERREAEARRAEAEAVAAAEAEAVVAAEAARVAAAAQAAAQAQAAADAQARAAAEAEAAAAAEAARIAAEAQAAAEAEARAAAEAARAAEEARAAEQAQRAAEAAARLDAEEAARAADAARAAEAAARFEAEAAAEAEAEAERVRLAFEPGRNLDDEIAAYERSLAEPAAPPVDALAAAAELEREPVIAEADAATESKLVGAEAEPEPVIAEAEPEPVIAEAEPVIAEVAAEPEPELVGAEAEPEPVIAEAEPVIAEVAAEPEPERIGAEAEPEPIIAEPEPEPIAAQGVATEPPAQPEWPTAELPVAAASAMQPPSAGIEPIPTAIGQPRPASVVDGALAWPEPVSAAAPFEPSWPDLAVPQRRTGAGLPAITAPAQPLAARSCPGCGLSLSASARFCRRCGTPQQVDAAR
jgi:hypothetical protein